MSSLQAQWQNGRSKQIHRTTQKHVEHHHWHNRHWEKKTKKIGDFTKHTLVYFK